VSEEKSRGQVNRKLEHERLDVYRIELDFVAWVGGILVEAAGSSGRAAATVCDHLDRASLSVLLNTAEGNGKRQRASRAKFFDDARGAAAECAACLDALVARRVCSEDRVRQGKQALVRIVSMLTKLVARFSDVGGVREDDEEYLFSGDFDDDDEDDWSYDEDEI
jgi:four helix bundle protein